MADPSDDAVSDDGPEGLADRVAREGEERLSRLIAELAEHPAVRRGLERSFEARERAAQVQDVVLAALNVPTASDIERLTRRVRSVSQRIEALEDGIDRIDDRLGELVAQVTALVAAMEPSNAAPAAPKRPKSATRTGSAGTGRRSQGRPGI